MALPLTLPESKHIGPSWHNSPEKLEQDAWFSTLLRPFTTVVAAEAILLLSKHGCYPFAQERIGYRGKPFPLAKMQVLESQVVPLGEDREKHIASPVAWLIDKLSIDSFIELNQTSTDPNVPGELATFGGPRPKMTDEYARIKQFMTEPTLDRFGTYSEPTQEDKSMYSIWEETTPNIRPAVWGNTSALGFTHTVGTYQYCKELVRLENHYYFNGSQATDFSIFVGLLVKGSEFIKAQTAGGSTAP